MRRIFSIHLRGKSWVAEIVPVKGLLHSLVWRASHCCVGITCYRCMHGVMDYVIHASASRCISRRVQMLVSGGGDGL